MSANAGQDLTRVTFNITPRASRALDEITARESGNRTDAINRALPGFALLLDLVDRGGGRLLLTNADGTTEEVRIL